MVPAESAITLPARLAAVRRTGLLDTAPEEPFDRLTRLACQLLGTPFGFVTVVDERRSFWKSCIGITSPALADRQNPVEESFCQYVIAGGEPVIIGDARLDPMTEHNPSITSMGVIAWAGFPVHSPDGQVLGSFCVVDTRPREWSAQDIRTLEVLSQAAGGEVALRIAADDAARDAQRYRQLARTLQESLLPPRLPAIDGLELAAGHRLAGAEALGDFYDVVQTPTGWAVFLGRPAGQGAQAARTGAVAKYSLRAAAARASSPAIVLTDLDAALHRWFAESGMPGSVTVSYLSLRRTGTGFAVRICTAGHPPAMIRRSDGTAEKLGRASSPLGSLPRLSLTIDEAELGAGDVLILYAGEAPRYADRGDATTGDGPASGSGSGSQLDAGRLYAGEIDAGRVDARWVDAARVDAGRVDAARVDAGPLDAGRVDAEPGRAGLVPRGSAQQAVDALLCDGRVVLAVRVPLSPGTVPLSPGTAAARP